MAEFKVDENGVKLKKVRWYTKRRKTKSRMWKAKWVPVTQSSAKGAGQGAGQGAKPPAKA